MYCRGITILTFKSGEYGMSLVGMFRAGGGYKVHWASSRGRVACIAVCKGGHE